MNLSAPSTGPLSQPERCRSTCRPPPELRRLRGEFRQSAGDWQRPITLLNRRFRRRPPYFWNASGEGITAGTTWALESNGKDHKQSLLPGVARLVLELAGQQGHQLAENARTRPVFIVAFDQVPGCGARGRLEQHLFHGIFVGAPLFAIAPVFVGELPGLVAAGFALFETAQLLVAGDVNPELGDDGAEILQLALEGVDLRVGAFPCVRSGEAFHALHHHATVP